MRDRVDILARILGLLDDALDSAVNVVNVREDIVDALGQVRVVVDDFDIGTTIPNLS
jgi:hypothetical protein